MTDATQSDFVPFENLLIIGVGLIGGSVGLAARQAGLARCVTGYSRRAETAQAALRHGSIDAVADDLHAALQAADAVFLAAPVAQFPALFHAIEAAGNSRAIVFDGGSTKVQVCEAARSVAARGAGAVSPWYFQFVPSHPIAGAERHGPDAARSDLYAGRTVIVCPHECSSDPAVQRVRAFWRALGMQVRQMDAAEHDRVFAAVSHLPHLLAYAYVHALLQNPQGASDMQEGGGGFRDFSRIAASSPEMWIDIFMDNRQQVLAHLDQFERSVACLRDGLMRGDRQALQNLLDPVSQFRGQWRGR